MADNGISKGNKILIVDDTPEFIGLLRVTLENEGYEIHEATSGEMALEMAQRVVPDMILLDIVMPGLDGLETCERLKNNPPLMDIPVIFISAKTELEDIVTGFNCGGVDYISKPFQREEVLARVKTHLDLKNLAKERENWISELQELNGKLKDLASKDPLTTLSNRRSMQNDLEEEKSRFMRNERAFSIILMDIDHFKNINDTLGHEAGDGVLVQLAGLFNSTARKQDKLARWGGEEFLLLLPETSLDEATVLAEKLRSKLASEVFYHEENKFSVTMSFGISSFDDRTMDLKTCIRIADDCLYQAKEEGRNCVVTQAGKAHVV